VRDALDKELELGLDNTTDSWKRGLLLAAKDARNTQQRILRVATLTLVVAVVGVLVALFR
jgi:hypothetical protein